MSMIAMLKELLPPYVGGQLEIQGASMEYILRGPISAVELDREGNLTVHFEWLAEKLVGGWEATENKSWKVSAVLLSVTPIGSERFLLSNTVTREHATLFPPGGSSLVREKVLGLDPTQ